jgi:penicillin amidase
MLASRPEPLIYSAWITELQRGLLADELGEPLFDALASPNVPLMVRILRDKPGWCDDGGTVQTETCDDAVALALERALDWISWRNGPDMSKWQWGNEHFAVHRHPLFDRIPLLGNFASVRFVSDGGSQTLNRASPSYRGNRPFDAVHGAGYRGIYDFSDLENSRFAMPLGQSGNMLSPWARNFVENWQSLSYIGIGGTRAETARTAIGTITLNPTAR